MEYVLKTYGLSKRFGSKLALDNVSINIKKGEIYGLDPEGIRDVRDLIQRLTVSAASVFTQCCLSRTQTSPNTGSPLFGEAPLSATLPCASGNTKRIYKKLCKAFALQSFLYIRLVFPLAHGKVAESSASPKSGDPVFGDV